MHDNVRPHQSPKYPCPTHPQSVSLGQSALSNRRSSADRALENSADGMTRVTLAGRPPHTVRAEPVEALLAASGRCASGDVCPSTSSGRTGWWTTPRSVRFERSRETLAQRWWPVCRLRSKRTGQETGAEPEPPTGQTQGRKPARTPNFPLTFRQAQPQPRAPTPPAPARSAPISPTRPAARATPGQSPSARHNT